MRTFFRVSVVVLFLAALAWASNPWESKPYQQWTQKDVMQVLNNSPWVKTTSVLVSWAQPSNNESEGGGARGRGGRGGSRQGPGNQDMFEARWISSKVIRQAVVRQNVLSGKMTQAQADSVVAQKVPAYELVLFGQDMSPLDKLSDADVAKAASIEMKVSKTKETAAQVRVERGANGKVAAVIFAFLRTVDGKPAIGPNEKEIDFVLEVGKLSVKMKFDVRKMTTKDGLDI